jgi:hypothetical protein
MNTQQPFGYGNANNQPTSSNYTEGPRGQNRQGQQNYPSQNARNNQNSRGQNSYQEDNRSGIINRGHNAQHGGRGKRHVSWRDD